MRYCLGSCALIFTLIVSCHLAKQNTGISRLKKYTDSLRSYEVIDSIRKIPTDLFEKSRFAGTNGTTIRYRLLKPSANSEQIKRPLILVLHGSGAIGEDNEKQLGALVKLWAQPAIREKYPAFVVAPQFSSRSSNYVMDSSRSVLTSVPQPCLQVALELIDSLKAVYPVDEKRVYVMGYSMGGSSVINSLILRPDLFAGGVSISGIPQFDQMKKLQHTPLWLIHGDQDTENPIASDIQFYKEVNAYHATRFWIVEGAGHGDIFSPVLFGNAFPEWLFGQRKK